MVGEKMKKIFMIGLGGTVDSANIEVHDMQFVSSETLEGTFNILKERWYGDILHIDSYTELKYINGYQIDLDKQTDQTLYMVVYGGYQENQIDEVHRYDFILEDNLVEAKKVAKKNMINYQYIDHIDGIVDVFHNIGETFGFNKGDYLLKDNITTHTYIELIKK
jgi:hypothetical protein